MSEFNPVSDSLKKWTGTCPGVLMNGNCSDKQCQLSHPTIQKVKKKRLQFKKKEFKPSKKIKKTSLKERMKEKTRANKKKTVAFMPTNKVSIFKKKNTSNEKQKEDKIAEMEKKLRNLHKCTCCKGNYNDCTNSSMCMGLGQCYCKMHFDMENTREDPNFDLGHFISEFPGHADWKVSANSMPFPEMGDDFVPECINCPCCNGYVYSCGGMNCFQGCTCLSLKM